MKLTKSAKRLGVFIFYDRDQMIDDYVMYMLDSLNDAVEKIIFVSNSDLSKEELSKLDKYNIDINIRENKGLDAGAFKYVYDKYKREYLSSFDELILLNDTFFGPFRPFKDIINDMGDRDIDFWGLTANFNSPDGTNHSKDGYIHSHIQTYFVAYRKNVLESDFFNKYWSKYDINKNNSFEKVVNNHETYFTYLLEKQGFKWDTYVNLDHYKKDEMKYNYNIYGYSAYTLLKYYNCPFIKRKNFVFNKLDALYMNNGLDTYKSLEWIKENTNYDINMIYKNILRLYEPRDLYQALNMNYIVSEKEDKKAKKLIIANINDEKSYELGKLYFNNIKKCDIKLYTENKNIINKEIEYTNNLYKKIIDTRNDLIKKYDYICLLDLKADDNSFQEVNDSNVIRVLDNSIKSDEYINGVVDIFENEIVNILYLPESFHNKNIKNLSGYNRMKNIEKINKRLSIKLPIDTTFVKSFDGLWIKSNVLNNIKEYDISYYELLSFFDIFCNDLFGKIYSSEYIKSDVLSLEIIGNYSLNKYKQKMIFPITMSYANTYNVLRRAFRRIVPMSTRKKLVKFFKI